MVSRYTGIVPQPNKAIVGRNAFAHEAGIHQDGVIKEAKTYETMDPSEFGVESIITFGPRSGRNALRAKYKRLGIGLSEEEFQAASNQFIRIADKTKEVDDADIIRAVKEGESIPEYYGLASYHPVKENRYEGVIKIREGKEIKTGYAEGNGQIDAAIKGIQKITNKDYGLEEFKVVSEGEGSDAVGYTKLELSKNGWRVIGRWKDTDVMTSAIKAFIDGCNRMKYIEEYFAAAKKHNL
jgi:2-isopropylmalate synthase